MAGCKIKQQAPLSAFPLLNAILFPNSIHLLSSLPVDAIVHPWYDIHFMPNYTISLYIILYHVHVDCEDVP